MTPQEANKLLTAARRHDHLVLATDEAFKTWAYALGPRKLPDGTTDPGVPFEVGELIVMDYYGCHPDPEKRKPLDASIIRRIYSSKMRELNARKRARQLPPPEVAANLAAFKARHMKNPEPRPRAGAFPYPQGGQDHE